MRTWATRGGFVKEGRRMFGRWRLQHSRFRVPPANARDHLAGFRADRSDHRRDRIHRPCRPTALSRAWRTAGSRVRLDLARLQSGVVVIPDRPGPRAPGGAPIAARARPAEPPGA